MYSNSIIIVDTAINVPGCAKERSVSLEMFFYGDEGGRGMID